MDQLKEVETLQPPLLFLGLSGINQQSRSWHALLPEVMKEVVQPDGTVKRVYIYTPHSLRATAATLLLGARTDIKKVQELLGHSQVTTTQIYDKRHFLYLRRREP